VLAPPRILSPLVIDCEPGAPFQSHGQCHTATEDRGVHEAQSRQMEEGLEETLGALRRRCREESETL